MSKIDPTQAGANGLIYSTFLGGTDGAIGDIGNGIATDLNGNASVTGETSSSDFPTMPGAVETTRNSAWTDGYLSQINTFGTGVLYSSYLGGSGANGDAALALAVDSVGDQFVGGETSSTDFPTTTGAFK